MPLPAKNMPRPANESDLIFPRELHELVEFRGLWRARKFESRHSRKNLASTVNRRAKARFVSPSTKGGAFSTLKVTWQASVPNWRERHQHKINVKKRKNLMTSLLTTQMAGNTEAATQAAVQAAAVAASQNHSLFTHMAIRGHEDGTRSGSGEVNLASDQPESLHGKQLLSVKFVKYDF